jgi:hypothetical protein
MAGGIWRSQNKILPGVYINVKSRQSVTANVGDRGTVAICKPLSWGPTGVVEEYKPGDDPTGIIGAGITSDAALFIREMIKGSDVTSGPNKILIYRPAGTSGAKATATIGDLTATALYDGVRGNDITIVVAADPDTEGGFIVSTVVDGSVVDAQAVTAIGSLVANAWVTFSGEGSLTASAGTALTGGVDPTVSASDYAAFFTAVEPYQFDIVAYDGSDSTVIAALAAFVTRMNESIGHKCQAVVANATALNSKFMISVKNGVKLSDGTALTAQDAVYWVAGAEAGATYYQSLTYAQYPGAVSANPKLTDAQAEEAVTGGQICFIDSFGVTKVCTDINSKTTVTTDEGAEFKKNRVMRVLNQFCNDVYEHFSNYFIGKADNNDAGRNLLRGWIIGYLNEMQANNGVQNFVADDVAVAAGNSIDSVVIGVAIQPVDAIEKIYITGTVSANTGAEA